MLLQLFQTNIKFTHNDACSEDLLPFRAQSKLCHCAFPLKIPGVRHVVITNYGSLEIRKSGIRQWYNIKKKVCKNLLPGAVNGNVFPVHATKA